MMVDMENHMFVRRSLWAMETCQMGNPWNNELLQFSQKFSKWSLLTIALSRRSFSSCSPWVAGAQALLARLRITSWETIYQLLLNHSGVAFLTLEDATTVIYLTILECWLETIISLEVNSSVLTIAIHPSLHQSPNSLNHLPFYLGTVNLKRQRELRKPTIWEENNMKNLGKMVSMVHICFLAHRLLY